MTSTNTHHDIPGVEFFGKGRGNFTLPCGYVDAAGVVHNDIHLREMTGTEDDILDDNDLVVNERITRVLSACTEKLGTVSDKKTIEAAISDNLSGIGNTGLPLSAQDRIAALLFLRRVTLGDVYKFERRCPRCGEINKNKQLDLRSLEITAVKEPTKRKVKVKLPRSGKVAVLKVLAAKGEELVSALKPTQKDLKTCAILARLESLDEKPMSSSPECVDLVRTLPQVDRSYLIQVYTLMEGNVDTNVQVTCKNQLCGIEFEFPLDLGQLFFSSQVKKPTLEDLTWL